MAYRRHAPESPAPLRARGSRRRPFYKPLADQRLDRHIEPCCLDAQAFQYRWRKIDRHGCHVSLTFATDIAGGIAWGWAERPMGGGIHSGAARSALHHMRRCATRRGRAWCVVRILFVCPFVPLSFCSSVLLFLCSFVPLFFCATLCAPHIRRASLESSFPALHAIDKPIPARHNANTGMYVPLCSM